MKPKTVSESEIPRGNTVAGVNAEIIEILLRAGAEMSGGNFLDVPCGGGEFLRAVKKFFPAARVIGADIKPPAQNFGGEFRQIDAQNLTEFAGEEKFQAITCISGVMEFDNTLNFFKKLKPRLTSGGLLIVTNDNLLSVRDRFSYLLFGRVKQFPAFTKFSEPTWKVLTLQNLRRILWEAGFAVEEIRYVPPPAKEWFWLPLALPIHLFQRLYLRTAEMDVARRKKFGDAFYFAVFETLYFRLPGVGRGRKF